jgi:hypothetical protein
MIKVSQHVSYNITATLHDDEVEQLRADNAAMYERKIHPTTRNFIRQIIEAIDEQGHGAQTDPPLEREELPVPMLGDDVTGRLDVINTEGLNPSAISDDEEPPLPIPTDEDGFERAIGVPEIKGMKALRGTSRLDARAAEAELDH